MSPKNGTTVPSCVECHRRKQKCNKQFPCNHCLKRGVSHLCRFVNKTAASKTSRDDGSPIDAPSRASRKRAADSPDPTGLFDGTADEDEGPAIDVSDALNALGYMPHDHHLVLGNGSGPKVGRDVVDNEPEPSEELKAALELMPAKPYTDCLVDNWLNGANHHYYALYPSEFRTQYDGWWATPPNKVTPELTSLILRVCACSLHFIIDDSVRERLETELKADAATFAQRMHTAADKLSQSISPGKGGLTHVQQLFLTAFWYKSAEKWTEAWHALSRAIRAANEIGLHKDSLSEGMSEFDREMRRRLWGVLYMWDFALGSMLSRPLLVNHADCTFEMPTLALEMDPERPNQPSPFRHMNLHCQLCLDCLAELAPRSPAEETNPTELAGRLRDAVEKWFSNLPAEYARKNPDTQWDSEFEWVVFQRRYLHLIGYMSLFSPLKPFVTRNSAKPMSDLESSLRASGVQAGLDLMDVSWSFFENMVSVGAKFHYAIFCIFDSATVMCSAFVHDEARNLPQRETVLHAINRGLHMLEEMYKESKTTAALYRILKGLLANLPLNAEEKGFVGAPKRIKARRAVSSGDGGDASASNPLARRILSESRPARNNSATSNDSSRGGSTPGSSSHSSQSPRVLLPATAQTGTSSSVYSHEYQPSTNAAAQPMHGQVFSHGSILPNDQSSSYFGSAGQYLHSIGVVPSSGFVSSDVMGSVGAFVPPNNYQYNANENINFQPVWHPSAEVNSGFQTPQNGNLQGQQDEQTVPAVLEYWDWQGLDLGHPGHWGNAQPPM
ncbi:fungal-specific transcription factor domain-containing protein [Podospora australis]|uniref:Fungal-specific transcription factor domain-containing protein n=1 Tax=Podospora australis TaxID=1536484 RepID=A0AAN6X5N7_9PEZI|nr:fungal-specific transcription factor domain-containing protein [Podospora australis]